MFLITKRKIVIQVVVLVFFLACFVLMTPTQANWSVWDEPEVYYDFEGIKSQTNIKDRAGNNDLTLSSISGSASGIQSLGKYGRRAEFNGTTDYGVADDSAAFSQTGSFSVEAWVKFDTVSDTDGDIQTVLAKWDETTDIRSYRLIVETDSDGRAWPKFQVSTDGTAANIKTATGKTQILANQWYLFQGYYNATSPGDIYIYINGVQEGTTSSVGTSISDTSSNFYLGTTKTGSSTYSHLLDGSVDEVRIFSGTRTDGSLAYSMERGKPVVKIDFDDGSGAQAMNRAENFSRSALVNFPTDNSQWVQGNNNYALEFDGTDEYVDLGEHTRFQLGGAITISTWINVSSLGNYALVSQSQANGYTFQLTSGGELEFGAIGGTTVTTTGADISTDEWTNVAVSYDGANASFYVDGRLISSPALSLWSVEDGATYVGRAGSTPNYFAGKMDDLLIYPYARTLFEIYVDHLGGAVKFGQLQSLEPANAQVACPEGYIHVPGDPLYGTSDFCVMKYEAKYDCTGDGDGDTATACSAPADGGDGVDYRALTFDSSNVVSTANGGPIVHITHDQAVNACPEGSHLITNSEWMTIARNAARQGANWADGVVGSTVASGGGLYRGNVGTNDSASYNGGTPEYGTGRDSKAELVLSNGETIWDLSGNVWQHVRRDEDDTLTDDLPSDGGAAGWRWIEHTDIVDYGELSYDIIRPFDSSHNANYGMGRVYTYNGSSSNRVFLRGGTWHAKTHAGAFTLHLAWTAGAQSNTVGFRCAASL